MPSYLPGHSGLLRASSRHSTADAVDPVLEHHGRQDLPAESALACAVNTQKLADESRQLLDCDSNPLGLCFKIQVERARDDAAMIGRLSVQADEVPSIQRQHCTRIVRRRFENRRISQGLAGQAQIRQSQHVVPKSLRASVTGYGKFSSARKRDATH